MTFDSSIAEWMTVPEKSVYVNGEWKEIAPSPSSPPLPVLNPATERVIATVPNSDATVVDLAVKSAREAFDNGPWGKTTGAERSHYLNAIADLVEKNRDRLAKLEAADCGKPFKESAWDMDDVAGCYRYYAKKAVELDSRQNTRVELPLDTFETVLRYDPYGVIAAIIPWNYPLLMASWKVAPALAAGCSVVLKPSELTPLTALEFANLCHQAGLPKGVLNVISGDGPNTGTPLTKHPLVDKIAFTGSVQTGSRVMTAAAQNVRGLSLELGGKSPLIIFDDVDIEKAVEWTMFGCFWTNGQICSATSRLLVSEAIADKFLERLVKETSSIHIGEPLANENLERTGMLGPLVSKGQLDRVLGYIEGAKNQGAKLLTGGKRPTNLSHGYYVEPTIFVVNANHTIWKEEIFGPVLSVMTFKTEEEAIQLANDTEYGLGSAVISNDPSRCDRVSRRMRSGIVWVNCSQPCFVETSWGGMKKSGFGRELGPFGLDNYLQVKQITKYVSDQPWGWYIKSPM